jgi:hypothetical protein
MNGRDTVPASELTETMYMPASGVHADTSTLVLPSLNALAVWTYRP